MHHLKRPTYTGMEEVVSGFDILNPEALYTFSIWHSLDDIALQCTSLDPTTQKEMLTRYLEQLNRAGNDDLLYMKFHPGEIAGYITKKTPVVSVTPFMLNEREESLSRVGARDYIPGNYEMREVMQVLKDLPATLDIKINDALDKKLAEMLPEVEQEEEDPIKYWTGVVTGVTQNPQVMAIIGQILNFIKPTEPNPAQFRSVGNINNTMTEQAQTRIPIAYDEELMNDSLTRLSYHINLGTDIKLLADMADKDPAYFANLLALLRK